MPRTTLWGDGTAVGESPPPTYQWEDDEGAPAAPEETRAMAESSAGPSLEGVDRECRITGVSDPRGGGGE